jgi:hypothetical protein
MKQRAKVSLKNGDEANSSTPAIAMILTTPLLLLSIGDDFQFQDPETAPWTGFGADGSSPPASPRKAAGMASPLLIKSPSSASSSSSKDQKVMAKPPVIAGCVGRGWSCGTLGSLLTRVLASLLKHWFLVGTAGGIIGAHVWPWFGSDAGPLKPQVTVKYGAVVAIFFISGATMKTEAMWATLKDWRQHLFIQAFSLVASPLLVRFALLPALRTWTALPEPLVQGFMVS